MKFSPNNPSVLKRLICETFLYRSKPHKNRIGIELELEGKDLVNPDWVSRYWKVVDEGSLRGGVEYVTGPQAVIGNLDQYLEDLEKALACAKPDLSIRTSTHVHINVHDFTLEEVYAVVAAFYLVEDTLVRANGKARTGNLFCLRGKDAEGIFSILIERARKGSHLAVDQNLRYGALNLNAIQKFGSVEFRFLRAMTDTKLLRIWVQGLHHMVQVARRLGSIQEVVFQYKRSSSSLLSFYRLLFPEEFVEMIKGNIVPDDELLPFLLLLNKTLKGLDKPKKVKYNFTVQEDLDPNATRDFPVEKVETQREISEEVTAKLVSSSPPQPQPQPTSIPIQWFTTNNF